MDNEEGGVIRFVTNIVSFEVLFALFLFAGVYNQAPWLEWVPVNITTIFAGLSFLAAVITILRGTVRPQRGGIILTALFAIFILYALASLSWSPGGGYASGKALRLVVATSWALAGPALIIAPQRRRVYRFLSVTVIIGLFTAVTTLLSSGGTMANPSANYLIAGRVVGLGALVSLWYLLAAPSGIWTRVAAAVGLFVSYIALIVGGGRAPFVTTLVATVGLVVVLATQQVWRARTDQTVTTDGGRTYLRWVAATLVGVAGTAAVVGAAFVYGWMPRTIMRLLTISTASGSSLGQRVGYWESSIRVIDTTPRWGHGLGSWPIVTLGDIANYPHNIVLEVLVELGAVGFVLLLLVFGFGLLSAFRTMRSGTRPAGWLLLALVGFTVINAMISGDINDNRYLFTYLGLLVAPSLGVRER